MDATNRTTPAAGLARVAGQDGRDAYPTALASPGLGARLEAALGWPIPADAGWANTLGAVLLFLLTSQLVTGVLLALYYCPSPDAARASLQFVMEGVDAGAWVRGLHAWGASAAIVAALLHMARVFWWGAFKPPRRATWVTGCLLFLCLLGMGFTGYLLPWDARGYFATQVAAQIAESTPVAGEAARRMLLGGEGLGALTLTRFYAVHILILPGVILLLGGLHVALVRRHGIAPRPVPVTGEASTRPDRRFFPDHAWKDAAAALAVALTVGALAWQFPPDLDIAPEEAPPDYAPRPEWYFLPLFQLLHYFPGRWMLVGTQLLPGAAVCLLLAWPWIDRGPERDPERRRGPIVFAACGVMAIMILFAFALRDTRPWEKRTYAATAARPAPPAAIATAGDAAAGKALFAGLDCALCHEGGNAPDLSCQGDRTHPAWTAAYLLAPHRIRWREAGIRPVERMPDFHFTRQEAEDLAAFLASRRNPRLFPETPLPPAAGSLVSRGRSLFLQHRCRNCHVRDGAGELAGPGLDAAPRRLRRDYVRAVLADPRKILPGGAMKEVRLLADEVEALTAYLLADRP